MLRQKEDKSFISQNSTDDGAFRGVVVVLLVINTNIRLPSSGLVTCTNFRSWLVNWARLKMYVHLSCSAWRIENYSATYLLYLIVPISEHRLFYGKYSPSSIAHSNCSERPMLAVFPSLFMLVVIYYFATGNTWIVIFVNVE